MHFVFRSILALYSFSLKLCSVKYLVYTRVSTLPKKVQISVQNPVQPQIQFAQYSSGTVKLTISKTQFFFTLGWSSQNTANILFVA